MLQSPIASKLPFTGSTGMGTSLNAQCAPLIRKLGLELGGNKPSIVIDDADLDGTIIARFRNNVQSRVCANRICVQAGVYNAFAKKQTAKLGALPTGNDFDDSMIFGPLIDDPAMDNVRDAVSKFATVLAGGCKRSALHSLSRRS